MRKKAIFTLSESTQGLLKRMGNASGYLDALVQARQRRAARALEVLRSGGWTPEEILACCEAANGVWESVIYPGAYAVWIDKILTADIDGRDLERRICESNSVAYALHEVVSEFWCGNTSVEDAIRKTTVC
jgi:hypothetical protein